MAVHVGEYEIENSKCKRLLDVKLDRRLISDICKKASGQLNALARIAPIIGLSKRRILMPSRHLPVQS